MTYPIVRAYESAAQAGDAADKLLAYGFPDNTVYTLTPPTESEAATNDTLAKALRAGQLMGDRAAFFAERVQQGRSVVVVDAPFGTGARAVEIMDACNPVDMQLLPPPAAYEWGKGAPFSELLCMPVLRRDSAAPLSRFFGFPLLVGARTSFGELVDSNFAASSTVGMPLLSRTGNPLSRLLGLGTLIRQGAPLSGPIGLPVKTSQAAPLSSLFGLPLLWNRAAPLSSLFRLPLLAQPR